jgi:hypothetical protein
MSFIKLEDNTYKENDIYKEIKEKFFEITNKGDKEYCDEIILACSSIIAYYTSLLFGDDEKNVKGYMELINKQILLEHKQIEDWKAKQRKKIVNGVYVP